MLKALLKYRDYLARIEDESPSYIMANHLLFAMSKSMPVTKNEFRDCCRSNFSAILLKYQDDILTLIQTKVKAAKTKNKNSHMVFEDNVKPARNPLAPETFEINQKIVSEFKSFENGSLPKF